MKVPRRWRFRVFYDLINNATGEREHHSKIVTVTKDGKFGILFPPGDYGFIPGSVRVENCTRNVPRAGDNADMADKLRIEIDRIYRADKRP